MALLCLCASTMQQSKCQSFCGCFFFGRGSLANGLASAMSQMRLFNSFLKHIWSHQFFDSHLYIFLVVIHPQDSAQPTDCKVKKWWLDQFCDPVDSALLDDQIYHPNNARVIAISKQWNSSQLPIGNDTWISMKWNLISSYEHYRLRIPPRCIWVQEWCKLMLY